jgi:hypothetical protein
MITEVASLIAYAKPEQSNQAHLLSQDRRQQLAEEVNCIVLGKSIQSPSLYILHKIDYGSNSLYSSSSSS